MRVQIIQIMHLKQAQYKIIQTMRLPAVSKMLSAVGCQAKMPTLLLWPSRVTVASVIGTVSPPSGMCHIYHQCNRRPLSAHFHTTNKRNKSLPCTILLNIF